MSTAPVGDVAFAEIGDGPRVAWLLHGILGSGRNWRTFARRLGQRCPGWRFILPDLRNHGETGPLDGAFTLAAVAADLRSLPSPELVIGHSFGGKVTLTLAREGIDARAVWVLDAVPVSVPGDAADSDVANVLRVLQAHAPSMPAADRRDVRAALLAEGLAPFLVDWLLTSLREGPDGWSWVWDLDGIAGMMRDYFDTDFGPWLGSHAGAPQVHLVRAGRSDRWTPDVLSRLALGPAVTLHVMPDVGHWLHVDDPDGLIELLAPSLS